MSNEQIISYLRFRGVNDLFYQNCLLYKEISSLRFKPCTIDRFDYLVSHLLDKSNKAGFGLIPTNNVLKTENTNYIAIGLIEGDDIVCMNLLEGYVCIWMIQTGNGEYIKIANSFKDFINKHTEQSESKHL